MCVFILTTQTGAAQVLSVQVQNNWPIDIILTSGTTQVQLDGFKEKLTEVLVQAGVARERIHIQAAETQNYSSQGGGLETLKNDWTKFPTIASDPYIAYGNLRGPFAPTHLAGGMLNLRDPETSNLTTAEMLYTVFCWGHHAGISTRVHKNSNGTFDYIVVLLQANYYTEPVIPYMYYVRNSPLMEGQSYRGSPLGGRDAPGAYPGFSEQSNATLLKRGTPVGVTVSGPPAHPNIYPDIGFNTTDYLLRVESQGDTHRVFVNGVLNMEVKTPYVPMGTMMYFVNYAGHSGIGYATFSISSTVPLVDAVRAPKYTPESQKFIIDVCDVPREDFENPQLVGELTQRLQAEQVHYLGWGTPTTQASMQGFIQHSEGQGKYFLNTDNDVYLKTAEYIEPIVNKSLTSQDDIYLLQGKNYLFESK